MLRVASKGCAPAFSDHKASANSISSARLSCGSILPHRRSQPDENVCVPALVHRAAHSGVSVHLVEALPGLVLVALAALQQIVRSNCFPVVIDVVAALAVGKYLDPLDETGGVRSGRRKRVSSVDVSDSEGQFDRLWIDEAGPAAQWNAADTRGGWQEGA